jgi:hypothetical protein
MDCQRLELIDGELIDKMGAKPRHSVAIIFIRAWLSKVFGDLFVGTEFAVDVSPEDNPTNLPQPDFIVLNVDASHFIETNPQPKDLQLVGDSTPRKRSYESKTCSSNHEPAMRLQS